MKKLLVLMAAGALSLTAATGTAFAAEGTKDVQVSYDADTIVDPDNPMDGDWSVTIPKSFNFTETSLTNANMGVKLNDIKNGGLPADKKTEVSVTSTTGYDLVNPSNDKIAYTLTYAATMAKNTAKQSIGFLSQDNKTIAGTATMTGTLTNDQSGLYKDILTYTVAGAVAK